MKITFKNLLKSALVMSVSGLALTSTAVFAQQDYEYTKHTYNSGQHAEVAYEGWEENEDGDRKSVV